MKVFIHCALTLSCAIASASFARSAVAEDKTGPVALYTFEEGPGKRVRDWSGHGNHGEIVDAEYVPLEDGYCLSFDTAEASVDCGNNPSLDLTGPLTMELWLLPLGGFEGGEAGIVGKSIDSFTLALSPNRTCWAYTTLDGGAGRTDARMRLELNSWVHIAVTFDGKDLRLYGNGELQDSAASVSARLRSIPGSFYLHYPVVWGDKVEPAFKCMMDDVRVYNRALAAQEVFAHFKEGARGKVKDTSWLDTIRVIPHVYPAADTLLVEVDYAGLRPLPDDARIALELSGITSGGRRTTTLSTTPTSPDLGYGHTTSVCPISAVSTVDKAEWMLSTRDIVPGDYEVRGVAKDARGNPIGAPATVTFKLPSAPPWITAGAGAKVLNNLVTELLAVRAPKDATSGGHRIVNPRDGWVFLSSRAAGEVTVSVDGESVLVHRQEPSPMEAMRFLSEGAHEIDVRCEEGARLETLVVRAIPEMLFDSIGYRPAPWLKCYGPYNWDFFKKAGILDTVNVLVERDRLPENEEHVREWKESGRRIVTASFIDSIKGKVGQLTAENTFDALTGLTGFTKADRDGTLMSEFDGGGYPTGLAGYPMFCEVARRLEGTQDFAGKVWDCYGKFMYYDDRSMAFMKALIDGGHRFAEEIYMQEQPTEESARKYLNAMMRQRMLRYQRLLPDCQKGMIATLAYFSIPCEIVNVDPNVNYRTFMDMQMNLLANDPVFSELAGVMWYHSSYADEESHRWAARLLRHYCIEGKREMLSKDPYELRHIRNADFREGDAGWTLNPAEEGSIAAVHVRGLGAAQGRYPDSAMGDWCLLTRRSAVKPNRFSQRIRGLVPRRLYSVKMLTTDYDDITKRRNTKSPHAASITVRDAEVLKEDSICELFTRQGGSYGNEDRPNNRWITYRVVFFRPRGTEAALTISDWESDKAAGGPVGRQLIHNFIEVQPELEE